MKPNVHKKVLIVLLVVFAVVLCAFFIYLYASSIGKSFPEKKELLTAVLVLGICVVPLACAISIYAKKANARMIHIPSVAFSCLCLFVILIFAGGLIFEKISDSNHIADTNGVDDTTLAAIEPFEILSPEDNFEAFSKTERYSIPTTDVDGALKKYDYHESTLISPKISGIKTLQATKSNHNRLTLDFTSQLEEGNMEIFVIMDNQIYAKVPINQEYSVTLSDVAGKTVVVKIAAESAKINIHVKRTLF